MMRYLALLILFLALTACGQRRTVALNWYLRLEASADCPDYGLYGGPNLLLCPVDRVVSNGDSILLSSGATCYFFRLEEYRDGEELPTIPCADTVDLIKTALWYWPK